MWCFASTSIRYFYFNSFREIFCLVERSWHLWVSQTIWMSEFRNPFYPLISLHPHRADHSSPCTIMHETWIMKYNENSLQANLQADKPHMPPRSLTHTIALQGWNSHLSISWKTITDLHRKHTHAHALTEGWGTSGWLHQALIKPSHHMGMGPKTEGEWILCVCVCVLVTERSPPAPIQVQHQHKGSMHHQIRFVLHALWRYCCPIKKTPPLPTHTHTLKVCWAQKSWSKALRRTRHCDYYLLLLYFSHFIPVSLISSCGLLSLTTLTSAPARHPENLENPHSQHTQRVPKPACWRRQTDIEF